MEAIPRRLRILHLISGEGRVGSAVSAVLVATGLRRRGHHVVVGCPAESHTYAMAVRAGLPVHLVPSGGKFDVTCAVAVARYCRAERIDILNAQESRDRYLAIFAGWFRAGAAIVLTRRIHFTTLRHVGPLIYNIGADVQIAVSEGVKESLLRGGVWKDRVCVVPNGVDVDKYTRLDVETVEGLRARYLPPAGSVLAIGIVARMENRKGHAVLFRALRHLDSDYRILALGLTSEGKQRARRLAIAEGVDPEKLTCLGFLSDIVPYYRLMDVNVLPSFVEGMPRSVIEAMASGVPSIGSDIGGTNELIVHGENGFLFPPGDHEELGRQLSLLAANRALREQLGSAAARTVRERFHIDRIAEETENVYYEVLKRKGKRSTP